jgi:hypothetical protein
MPTFLPKRKITNAISHDKKTSQQANGRGRPHQIRLKADGNANKSAAQAWVF